MLAVKAWPGVDRAFCCICLSLYVCTRSKTRNLATAEGLRAHARSVEILSTTAELYQNAT